MPNIGDIIRAEDINNIKSGGYIGQIIAFTSNLIPSNVLICDGAELSRETYLELFNVIGTIYGEGDGSTTFNIPDLRDVWLVGSGIEHNVGESVAEGLPNITGVTGGSNGYCYSGGEGAFLGSGPRGYVLSIQAASPGNYPVLNIDASRSSPIYGASDHVTPNSIALLLCIIYE